MRILTFLLLVFVMGSACGSKTNTNNATETPVEAAPVVNEDDLLLRLSAYLSTDTSRAARDHPRGSPRARPGR